MARVAVLILFFWVLATELILIPVVLRPGVAEEQRRTQFQALVDADAVPQKYSSFALRANLRASVAETVVLLIALLVPGFLLEVLKRWYRRRSRLIRAGESCILLIGMYVLVLSPAITSGMQRLLLS